MAMKLTAFYETGRLTSHVRKNDSLVRIEHINSAIFLHPISLRSISILSSCLYLFLTLVLVRFFFPTKHIARNSILIISKRSVAHGQANRQTYPVGSTELIAGNKEGLQTAFPKHSRTRL